MVPRGLRKDLARIFWSTTDGQLDLLLIQPEVNLPHAAHLCKLAKDQVDGRPDPGIGIFLDAILRSFDVADCNASNQGATLRLLQQRRLRTLAECRDFHLADRTLHPQQQSIVREFGIIDGLGIDQQCTHDTAKVQQGMPFPTIACQPRRLNAEYGANLPIAEHAQQAFKSGAACSVPRNSEIVIDDIDVEPAQRPCTIGQAILPTFTFKVVFHLIRSGLTDVHTGPPSQMISGDLIHRRPPRGSSWPAPASTAPALGGVGLAPPKGVVRRGERRELRRTSVVGGLLGGAASWFSSRTLCTHDGRPVTHTPRHYTRTRN